MTPEAIGTFVTSLPQWAASVAVVISLFKLWARFHKLEMDATARQGDTAIMFSCLRGCLRGLIEIGADGPVKGALDELNAHLERRAVGLPSKA